MLNTMVNTHANAIRFDDSVATQSTVDMTIYRPRLQKLHASKTILQAKRLSASSEKPVTPVVDIPLGLY